MGILTYISFLLIPSFLLGEIGLITVYPGVNLRLLDVSVFILVSVWFVHRVITKKLPLIPRSDLLLIAFITSGIFALMINTQLNHLEIISSTLYALRYLLYASLIWVIQDSKKQVILNGMIIVGTLLILIGYIQYLLYPNLRNLYYLGWDEHMYRLFSSFLDPNFAGAFFVLIFLLFAHHFFSNQKKVLFGILSFLAIVAIFLTFSRSAYLMLIGSSTMYFLLRKQVKLIGIIVGILLVGFALSSKYFYLENINPFRTASSEARIITMQEAIHIIQKNPVLGVGFNAYRYALIQESFRNSEGAYKSHADGSTDNSYLFILATTGGVGFGIYLLFWKGLVQEAYLKYKKNKKSIASVCIASIIGIGINSLFINSQFYPYILVWVFVLLGLMRSE